MGDDGKLVRDNIPDIIRAGGQLPVIRSADPGEYRALLRAKLAEETDEFLASEDDPEELADVLEVVRALADDLGVSPADLEALARGKSSGRGGFAKRLVWCGNLDLEPGQWRGRARAARAPSTCCISTGHTTRTHGITPETQDLAARLDAHVRGRGARLVEVITQAGIGFTLARTWPETTRDREDSLKHCGDARRFCPECGVKPRQQPAVTMMARRLSIYELKRGGTWADRTSLPEITDYPPATPRWAAYRKEPEMFGSKARAMRRQQAAEPRQQAEADRLFALADELEAQAGARPNYQREITAERAARIRAELGALAQDSRQQEREPRLGGADLDAEIDRLAEAFPAVREADAWAHGAQQPQAQTQPEAGA